jgi:predicted acyltransferase
MNKTFTAQAVSPDGLLKETTRQRYLSLDVLRGMTIALMIVVNTPGSWQTIYAPFRHAEWHGFTITDLVFPTFLFVVGNAMSFSMRRFEGQGDGAFLRKVLKRTALIFLIGLFLNSFPFFVRTSSGEFAMFDFSGIRVMGVLQRIALCYGIAALVIHYFKVRGAIIFSAVALLSYWAIMYLFGDQPDPYSLEANAALKFDLLLISTDNLYKGYGIPFDPEGLLSTLPAVVNVIGGFLAGLYIQRNGNNVGTVFKLALLAAVCIVVALLWDVYFPINKPIWTSSYVVYTIGLDLLVLSVLMLVIEVAGYKGWTYFFEVFGRNPLFIYALSGIIIKLMGLVRVDGRGLNGWLYNNAFLSWLQPNNASLLFAISYMLLLWLIGYWMDKKRVYIKV